jgi:hypothetical protein
MSTTLTRTLSLGFGLLAVLLQVVTSAAGADLQLTGPFTHENLTIYLIQGNANAKSKLLPLQQAMAAKKVAVYETGNVSELSIENRSDEDVYVQSGDIVKGGRQDRVLTTDFVLPAHSGKLPISSFCVEQGRWTKRGTESDAQFSGSANSVSSKDLKLAVKKPGAQSEVWASVAQARMALAAPAAPPPPNGPSTAAVGGVGLASSTSMQLALEAKPVVDATEAYVKALAKIVDTRPEVGGYVYAINGEINSADVYASPELFRQMWPKLLRASATEAVAEKPKAKSKTPPTAADVKTALADADRANPSSKQTAGSSTVTRKESAKVVMFETHDSNQGSDWIHRIYVVK